MQLNLMLPTRNSKDKLMNYVTLQHYNEHKYIAAPHYTSA